MVNLKKYQKIGVRKIESFQGRVLLADDMGLGKTVQTLKYVDNHPELRPVLIISPSFLKWVWESQLKTHFHKRGEVLSGTKPILTNKLLKNNIFIINYEILRHWISTLRELKPKIVIIDECHRQKSSTAKITKAIRILCRDIKHIICISGTPFLNRPIELFTTLNLLWPKEFPSKWSFGFRYCKPTRRPWGWEFKGATHLDELHEKLKSLGMIRRLKTEVLKQLPDKTREIIPVKISKISKYNEANKDFLTWLYKISAEKADKAKKAEALTKLGYLLRLSAKLKLKKVIEWVDNFLETNDEKIVLFCTHRKIIKKLHKKYKKISVVVDGSVSAKKKKLAVQSFQTNKKIKIFIGNIRAAGVGIDLWAASTCAFVELDWVPGNHTQAEDRLHRIGQKNPVTIYYIIAKDTIEEDLCKLIQKKQNIINQTLDGGKTYNTFDIYDELIKKIRK